MKAGRQRRPDNPGEHRVCETHAPDFTLTLLTDERQRPWAAEPN